VTDTAATFAASITGSEDEVATHAPLRGDIIYKINGVDIGPLHINAIWELWGKATTIAVITNTDYQTSNNDHEQPLTKKAQPLTKKAPRKQAKKEESEQKPNEEEFTHFHLMANHNNYSTDGIPTYNSRSTQDVIKDQIIRWDSIQGGRPRAMMAATGGYRILP
jgi:hypothetical protein